MTSEYVRGLEDAALVCESVWKRYGDDDAAMICATEIRALALRAPAQAGGWVAVSERLPENDEPVLMWNRVRGKAEIGTQTFLFRWMHYHQHNGGTTDWTHWQPLPPPPVQHVEGASHD